MKPKETGYHDRRGIPICVGDLIRVKHFMHYRRREQMWLYFIVGEVDGHFVLHAWSGTDGPQCQVKHCIINSSDTEVLRHQPNADVMFNERPRKKVKHGS